MNESKKSNRKKLKKMFFAFIILFLISNIFIIYNILLLKGIENLIRYLAIGFISFTSLLLSLWSFKSFVKRRSKRFIIATILISLLIAVYFACGYYINKAYSSISSINKDEVTYSTSLVVLKTSKIDNVSDLKNKKVGIIKDTKNIEGYVISQEIINDEKINKKNLIEYDDSLSMMTDLYDGEIDALFISSSYVSMFGSIETFENIKDETLAIATKEKVMKKQVEIVNSKSNLTEPFTILLMGIDSEKIGISSGAFNGDTLILITFNPKTLNATMLSIPRDTFVPIMCARNHALGKINSAAWQGESCMIKTIENLTNIKIDYYVKINFKGVVSLVDALDGIIVDVPYSFCEQNSSRQWGKNTIYVEKGIQTLNGEQALALARNRHPNPSYCNSKWTNYTSSDLVRGQNQQLIVKSLLDKIKTIRDINTFYELLDIVETNMDTNLTTNQILSFYNLGKDIMSSMKNNNDEVITFDRLYLTTRTQMIYNESARGERSDEIYSETSLKGIVNAMKTNLGLTKSSTIKEFNFSINDIYEPKVIGKGNEYKVTLFDLVPDFTNTNKKYTIYNKASATAWGTSKNVNITFITVESSSDKYVDGQITEQSIPAKVMVNDIKQRGIVLTIVKKIEAKPIDERMDCTEEKNKDNSLCKIPNFEGDNISDVNAWQSKIIPEKIISKTSSSEVDECRDKNDGEVIYQTADTAGKYIYDLDPSDRTITIRYCDIEEVTD